MDPAKFRAYLVAEVGEKEADLMTVSPGDDKGGHHSLYAKDAGAIVAPASPGQSDRKAKNLRAVLRAPEVIQELYRADLIPQAVAAKLGPKSSRSASEAKNSATVTISP